MAPDCALHFNPRFNQNCIVRNTMQSGSWGFEERDGGLPFAKGQLFEIIIMTTASSYQVCVIVLSQQSEYLVVIRSKQAATRFASLLCLSSQNT